MFNFGKLAHMFNRTQRSNQDTALGVTAIANSFHGIKLIWANAHLSVLLLSSASSLRQKMRRCKYWLDFRALLVQTCQVKERATKEG